MSLARLFETAHGDDNGSIAAESLARGCNRPSRTRVFERAEAPDAAAETRSVAPQSEAQPLCPMHRSRGLRPGSGARRLYLEEGAAQTMGVWCAQMVCGLERRLSTRCSCRERSIRVDSEFLNVPARPHRLVRTLDPSRHRRSAALAMPALDALLVQGSEEHVEGCTDAVGGDIDAHRTKRRLIRLTQ